MANILSIETSTTSSSTTPNLLPAKINHDGPIAIGGRRYWDPQTTQSPTTTISQSDLDSSTESTTPTSHQAAYFRGRKLQGRSLQLPANYQGYVLRKTNRVLPQQNPTTSTLDSRPPALLAAQLLDDENEDEDDDGEEDPYRRMLMRQQRQQQAKTAGSATEVAEEEDMVKILEVQHTFDEFVVWGHDEIPDDDNAYVRGIQEWIGFAETIHNGDEDVS